MPVREKRHSKCQWSRAAQRTICWSGSRTNLSVPPRSLGSPPDNLDRHRCAPHCPRRCRAISGTSHLHGWLRPAIPAQRPAALWSCSTPDSSSVTGGATASQPAHTSGSRAPRLRSGSPQPTTHAPALAATSRGVHAVLSRLRQRSRTVPEHWLLGHPAVSNAYARRTDRG